MSFPAQVPAIEYLKVAVFFSDKKVDVTPKPSYYYKAITSDQKRLKFQVNGHSFQRKPKTGRILETATRVGFLHSLPRYRAPPLLGL